MTVTFPQILYYCFIIVILFGFEQNVTPPPLKCENLKRSESSNHWGKTSCGEHAEWRILFHTDSRYCIFLLLCLKLNSYAFTCTAFSPYNLFCTQHCGYFYLVLWPGRVNRGCRKCARHYCVGYGHI